MSTQASKGINRKDIYTIIGVLIIYLFGYICPPFGGITPLGMKMMGVLIGLIFMTCAGCNIICSSLLALMAFVIHGYYKPADLLAGWMGSTTTFQIIFCGALCIFMRESGAMDVLAKKMMTSKICKGRPAVLLLMILVAAFCVSIFVSGAPFFLLFFGLMDSVLGIAGYDEKDPVRPLLLLGIYIGGYGAFLLPWKGAMAVTVAMFNSVLEPYGFVFNDWIYLVVELVTFLGFDVIYVLVLKYVLKVDLSKLASVDLSTVETFQKIPDKFDFFMKVGLGSLLFCFVYIFAVNLLPKTLPGYAVWGSLGISMIWLVPLVFFSLVRKDGKPIMNVGKLAQQGSLWMMIALVGSLTMLGKITTDAELGIRGWMVSVFTPLFGNMNIWVLMALIAAFTLIVTQVVNGQVLTMGLTPVVGPIVCTMIAEQGATISPSVVLTVLSSCAVVAWMTVSGSVNAAYLLNRKEITQKFLFSKSIIVMGIFLAWQYIVAMVLNFAFPGL